MRTTVTPAGATSSLEAWSWVEPHLPFVPGETLGLLCQTGSGGASASFPSWRRCVGREGFVAFGDGGLAVARLGCVVLASTPGVSSRAQCTLSSALYNRLLSELG
jgi:hypothetical protein